MTGRPPPGPSEPGRVLPVLDRLAPAPPKSLVISLIDGHTVDGDIVGRWFVAMPGGLGHPYLSTDRGRTE